MPLILGHSSAFVVRQGRQSRMSSNASSTASSAPSSVDQQHVHSHSNSDSGLSSLTGNINATDIDHGLMITYEDKNQTKKVI